LSVVLHFGWSLEHVSKRQTYKERH